MSGDDGIRTRTNRSTICRAQPLTLRHHVCPSAAQVGFEPTASLVLSQSGLTDCLDDPASVLSGDTCRPYQHGNHRITSVRTAEFEPAVSCAQSRRNTSLSYVLNSTARKSAQRESNPHFRHGKATGCRYIMGAEVGNRIVKELRAPGGTRTLVTAVRVRRLRLWTTSAFLSVGPAGLEPAPAWLRASGCCR